MLRWTSRSTTRRDWGPLLLHCRRSYASTLSSLETVKVPCHSNGYITLEYVPVVFLRPARALSDDTVFTARRSHHQGRPRRLLC